MRKSQQVSDKTDFSGYIKAMSVGLGFGFLITFILLLIFSIILNIKDYPHSFVDPLAIVAIGIGNLVSGFTVGKILRKKGFMFGILSGLIFALIILALGIIFTQGQIGLTTLYKFISAIALSAIGGILGVNKKTK